MGNVIYYKDRIYLVPGSQLKPKIMQETHDSPLARHQGFLKTYRKIRERFTWKYLKEYVLKIVKECDIFQRNKAEHTYPKGLLQPLPILDQKWGSISMDFIMGLTKV